MAKIDQGSATGTAAETEGKDAGPRSLWIGCTDSALPGPVSAGGGSHLYYSNFGNQIAVSDIGCLAAIEMAINMFGVDELVICGHYGCRAAEAALNDTRGAALGDWLRPLRQLGDRTLDAGFGDARRRADILAELNVIEQMKNIAATSIVRAASKKGLRLRIVGIMLDTHTHAIRTVGESELSPAASARD